MIPPILKQIWVASGVLLNSIGQGFLLSYPFCLLPALRGEDSPIKVDQETASWIASCMAISMCIGLCIGSFVMKIYGRRFAQAIMILPGILGWLIVYFANNVSMLMIGRLVGGVYHGSTYIIGSVILAEYTTPKYRGIFLNLKTAALCVGYTIMHIIGTYYNWRTVALCCMIPLMVSFCITCSWKESPSWLIIQNKIKESEHSFFWMRGISDESRREFERMICAQKKRMSNAPKKLNSVQMVLCLFKQVIKKDFAKPLFIIFVAFILVEGSGRYIFPAYASDIMKQMYDDSSQSFLFTIVIDLIMILCNFVSCILMKLVNRRTLLFSSGISSCIVLSCTSLYLFLVSNDTVSKDRSWLVSSMLVAYFICSNLGITAIPLVIFGELFPLPHREAGSAIAATLNSLSLFVALKLPPMMLPSLKVHGTFAVLVIIMSITLLYLYFTLPETRDKTLQEIEDFFNNGTLLANGNQNDVERDPMIFEELVKK